MTALIHRAALSLAACFFMAMFVLLPTNQAHADNVKPHWMTKPCKYEDSVNCVWNAGTSGNHSGHTFYVRYFGPSSTTCVFYAQRWYAKHNDFCIVGKPTLDTYR